MRDLRGNSVIRAANDILRDRRYFGDIDTGVTSVLSTEETQLFMAGQGQKVANLSTGAEVTMKKCDTSLYNNGTIPNAQKFTVTAIGIDIHLSNQSATTPFTDDTVTSIDVSPLKVDNPYPLVDNIRSQGVFSLYKNATIFVEQGNVSDYPCGLYNSGWGSDGSNAGHADGAAVPATTGFLVAQNGMSFRPLSVWHVLEELDQFNGRFEMCRPLVLTGTGLAGYIDFLLVGQADVDYKGQSIVQNFLS
jgi:hypothetical protein